MNKTCDTGRRPDCQIRHTIGQYPYECAAKDLAPRATVSYCDTHLTWWTDTRMNEQLPVTA
jgi:hypothetical protein